MQEVIAEQSHEQEDQEAPCPRSKNPVIHPQYHRNQSRHSDLMFARELRCVMMAELFVAQHVNEDRREDEGQRLA